MSSACKRVTLTLPQVDQALREFDRGPHRNVMFQAVQCDTCGGWHLVKNLKPKHWKNARKRR